MRAQRTESLLSATFSTPARPTYRGEIMLDPWIIEEIKRREEGTRDEGRRLELPLEKPIYDEGPSTEDSGSDRGVTVIDL